MMATVRHVTSGLGLRKFQADGFPLTRVYNESLDVFSNSRWFLKLRVDVLCAALYVLRWYKNSYLWFQWNIL